MDGERVDDEFEALPFAAGEMDTEAGFAGESGEGVASGWSGEDEGGFEDERGRMRMGGRGGGGRGGMAQGGARPVYRAGARPGRGPVARPSRPQGMPAPYPGPRPGPRGPRPGRWPRGSYWGPFYGWPGGVMVSEPFGYPLAARDEPSNGGAAPAPAPAFEPIDLPVTDGGDGDNGAGSGGEDPAQDEMPGTLRRLLDSMGTTAPAYQHRGSLEDVPRLNLPRRPGFYLITFRKGNAWKAYSGQTGDLHARLLKHRLGATVLGCDVRNHQVHIAEGSRDERARRNIEMAINRAMLRNHAGVLTNRNAELEMELLGWD